MEEEMKEEPQMEKGPFDKFLVVRDLSTEQIGYSSTSLDEIQDFIQKDPKAHDHHVEMICPGWYEDEFTLKLIPVIARFEAKVLPQA